jgi:hypothetical protein
VSGKDRVRFPVPPYFFPDNDWELKFEILGKSKGFSKEKAVLEPLPRLGGVKDRSS